MEKKEKNIKLKKDNYTFLFVFGLLLFIFSIPLIVKWLSEDSCLNLSSKSALGDAIGGLTNPIIGIGGIILTFLAFYIQYQFNKEQSNLIAEQRKERIEDKDNSEIERNFNFLSSEFLRIESKILKLNDSCMQFGKMQPRNINKFDISKIFNEMIYSITLYNNLIRLIDIKKIDNYKINNIFIHNNDRILLSNIYFLYRIIFNNALISFEAIKDIVLGSKLLPEEDDLVKNYHKELDELKIHLATIKDLLFTTYPYSNNN